MKIFKKTVRNLSITDYYIWFMSNISKNSDVLNLVKKAQRGCQQSMDSLTQQANGTIFGYIYRITLNWDIAEDLQQETLLEMVRSLKNLRKPHLFWSWLYRLALSKVQHHYRWKKTQTISPAEKERLLQKSLQGDYDELKNLISKELGACRRT